MKLNVGDIINCYDGIRGFLGFDMDADIAHKLSMMLEKLEDEYKKYAILQDALIEKYGEILDGKKVITENSSGWEDFSNEISVIRAQEIEVKVYTIKAETLKGIKAPGKFAASFRKLITSSEVLEEA